MYSRIKGTYKGNEVDKEYDNTWGATEYFEELTGEELNEYFVTNIHRRYNNSDIEVDQCIDRNGKFKIAICTLKVDELDIQILQIS